jgi:peptide methionine sulfoxide reductase MsrA
MSWFSRKYTNSDYTDNKEVIKEYFDKKTLEQERLLAEFWKEYEDDERGA